MANDSILTRPEVESRQRDNIAMRVGECAALIQTPSDGHILATLEALTIASGVRIVATKPVAE